MASGYCPDCDERISLRKPRIGQKFICLFCETEIEVIGIEPLDLDWADDSLDDEDWADEDQDD